MTATGEQRKGNGKGFRQAASLVSDRIRKAGESRGFAVARLLTHWAEIVGPDTAALCRPSKVGYGREGFGATLTVLCGGAVAPLVQMKAEDIRARVNACYGYNAISRVRITQTAPDAVPGFAEPQAAFLPPKTPHAGAAQVAAVVEEVRDPGLRAALEALGRNLAARTEDMQGKRQR